MILAFLQDWLDFRGGFFRGLLVGLGLMAALGFYLIFRAWVRGDLPEWRRKVRVEFIHPVFGRRESKTDDESVED